MVKKSKRADVKFVRLFLFFAVHGTPDCNLLMILKKTAIKHYLNLSLTIIIAIFYIIQFESIK